MTKREMATITKKIKAHQAAIGKHRDALRALMEDLEGQVDVASDALESLGYAVDALSQYQ